MLVALKVEQLEYLKKKKFSRYKIIQIDDKCYSVLTHVRLIVLFKYCYNIVILMSIVIYMPNG